MSEFLDVLAYMLAAGMLVLLVTGFVSVLRRRPRRAGASRQGPQGDGGGSPPEHRSDRV